MNKKEKEGVMEYEDYDLPRAFILFDDKKKYKIKLSRISGAGLKTRIEGVDIQDQ